jgi:hypothetical protein
MNLKKALAAKFDKAYILGTGPSLEKAIDRDWSDGVRIVSNTIVKDKELWEHLNPHFIVAGDAIYHFGASSFAETFRNDLEICLGLTETYFIFPAIFYVFCLKEFPDYKHRFIPIPFGTAESIHNDLTKDYYLPIHGNALPLLLLPLACTLAKTVCLWGFDGRAPGDANFWKNSSKHFYTDKVEHIMDLHPAFFEHLIPKAAPESYVKNVHGDVLDNALKDAENEGFIFRMMHPSYTETLNKRHE